MSDCVSITFNFHCFGGNTVDLSIYHVPMTQFDAVNGIVKSFISRMEDHRLAHLRSTIDDVVE